MPDFKVQRKATKIILRRKKLSYEMRLKVLKLPTLVYRRTRGDMIEIYKIAMAKHDIHCCPKLNLRSSVVSDIETRGNMYKLIPVRCKYVLHKSFLTNCAVWIWNSLPNSVVSAESVNMFQVKVRQVLVSAWFCLQLPSQSTWYWKLYVNYTVKLSTCLYYRKSYISRNKRPFRPASVDSSLPVTCYYQSV